MIIRHLPLGPKGHFLLGNLPEIRRDRLGFFSRCAREYGDIVSLRYGPRHIYMLNHPEYIEYVLATHHRNFTKHFALRLNRRVFGNGLLTSESDFWLRQRRLAQPAFHRNRIAAYGEAMVNFTERMLATWRDGETRDVHEAMMRLTLEIIAKTLFDADVAGEASEVGRMMEALMKNFAARVNSAFPLPERVPTPSNLRLQRATRRVEAVIYRVIQQRRSSGEDRGDLLSLFLQTRHEDDGSPMSDQQLRDEVMTLFLAGHETTAIALSWTWYLLSQHPQVEARLLAELQAALGGRSPSVADLPQLRYTEMVISEAMRLYPPAWAIGREAIQDCEIGGYPVPAGTTLMMSQWVMHRDARYFDHPEAFRPERWADGLATRLPKYAYFPFGGGPRLCIGHAFAMMEAVLLLATIAQKFRLRLVPGHPIEPWPSITLRPKHGLKMMLHER